MSNRNSNKGQRKHRASKQAAKGDLLSNNSHLAMTKSTIVSEDTATKHLSTPNDGGTP